ncbi:hypothetical protein HOH45_07085 [bacterium]|nr:hypothetical protein [bacterium]
MINTHSQAINRTLSNSKPLLFLFICFFCFLSLLTTIQATPSYVIDNFENKDYLRNPEWWTLGSPNLIFEENGVLENEENSILDNYILGKTSLSISGTADLWYLGGIGTFLATNASKYDALEIKLKAINKKHGRIKIELYDDDNNNWKIEPSKQMPSKTQYDDKFFYYINLDWDGWRTLTIPFTDFLDENKHIGDNEWNPSQVQGSGGLIQMQLLLFSNTKHGTFETWIDSIKLVHLKK